MAFLNYEKSDNTTLYIGIGLLVLGVLLNLLMICCCCKLLLKDRRIEKPVKSNKKSKDEQMGVKTD
ncbi:hypothetical protein KM1_006580 [Entamoeba histolytica HM-3:IMSS]|nr:hypothetical protein KM1_006580 [Entamoeba histolytica HM-3:IMSS]